jgi:hypothetical protein
LHLDRLGLIGILIGAGIFKVTSEAGAITAEEMQKRIAAARNTPEFRDMMRFLRRGSAYVTITPRRC